MTPRLVRPSPSYLQAFASSSSRSSSIGDGGWSPVPRIPPPPPDAFTPASGAAHTVLVAASELLFE